MAQKTHTTLRPLHDRVLVKRLAEGDDKHGSIIIPDTAKEKPQEGKVMADGAGRGNEPGQNHPPPVKAGHRSLFGKESRSEVKLDCEEFPYTDEAGILRRRG